VISWNSRPFSRLTTAWSLKAGNLSPTVSMDPPLYFFQF
jgi:hypothetical protein